MMRTVSLLAVAAMLFSCDSGSVTGNGDTDTRADGAAHGDTTAGDPAAGDPTPMNQAPTADPGGPYAVLTGAEATLDGSASSDPESDPLTYA